ncbi:MAG: glycosyltransferase [Bacillaceae bacterium]|nr:glycosyltransferase [Bacillaceae bacterium]
MKKVAHLKYRLEHSHSTPQTRDVPGYRHIQLFRSRSRVKDKSLLDKHVFFLDEMASKQFFLKEQQVDLFHAHHGNLGVRMRRTCKKAEIPLVVSFRGKDATAARGSYKKKLQKLWRDAALFLPVCRFLGEKINDRGCPPEKIRILYGGVDLERFIYRTPLPQEQVEILAIGRLVEKKGHHVLMDAFARIKNRYPHTRLTVIGKGKKEMKQELEKRARLLNLGDSFRLLTGISHTEIPRYLHEADIFCAPSLTGKNRDMEGIPNTLKEAMAVGLPVISTYHAGIPELVRNLYNGVLVRENDVDELADALRFLLEHREKWDLLSRHARRTIENSFNLKKQLQKQKEYYDLILNS